MVAWSAMLRRGRHVGRRANQQPVLRRNVVRNALGPDLITLTCQAPGAYDVDRERIVHPPGERAGVRGLDVVTTRQHRDPRARDRREVEHEIRQPTTGM